MTVIPSPPFANSLHQDVEDALRAAVVFKAVSAAGWHQFNCVLCTDRKYRGGLLFDARGIIFKCFNCSEKIGWKADRPMSRRFQQLLVDLGVDVRLANDLALRSRASLATLSDAGDGASGFQSSNPADFLKSQNMTAVKPPVFPAVPLPSGALKLIDADERYVDHLDYMTSRGFVHASDFDDIWVSTDAWGKYDRRVFVVFRAPDASVIGWSGRLIDELGPGDRKYMSKGRGFYGMDKAFDPAWRDAALFVCEGVLDAKFVAGVALGSNVLDADQQQALKASPRPKIVVPDSDAAGKRLGPIAVANGWRIAAIPAEWRQSGIKDVADACAAYGRHYVAWRLLRAAGQPHVKQNDIRGAVASRIVAAA